MSRLFTLLLVSLVQVAGGGLIAQGVANGWPLSPVANLVNFKLDNGLTVIFVEDHEVPTVTFQLFADYPLDLAYPASGVGEITGPLLRAGTSSRSGATIAGTIERLEADFRTDSHGIVARAKSSDRENLLALLADCIINSDFPPAAVQALQVAYLGQLQVNQQNPAAIAENLAKRLCYGTSHPYGEVPTEASLAAISPATCQAFHRRNFRPVVSYLVLVGDLQPAEARRLATTYFGNWQVPGKAVAQLFDTPPLEKGAVIHLVNCPGGPSAALDLSYSVKLKPNSADALKVDLLNRLFNQQWLADLPELNPAANPATAYTAVARLTADPTMGSFRAAAVVPNELVDTVVAGVFKTMSRLDSELVNPAALQAAKEQVKADFLTSLANPITRATLAMNTVRFRLPPAYYPNYLDNLAKIKATEVLEIARYYLDPSRIQVVVVGDPGLATGLQRFSRSPVRYLSPAGDTQQLMAPLQMETIQPAAVIENYLAAIGGRALLLQARDLRTIFTGQTPDGLPLRQVEERKEGHKMRQQLWLDGELYSEAIVNGKEVRITQKGERMAIDDAALAALQVANPLFPAARYQALGYQLTYGGMENVNGRIAHIINVKHPGDQWQVQEYYDTVTALKIRTRSTENGAIVTTDYRDYREVAGMLYPHKWRTVSTDSNNNPLEMQLESLQINTNIPDRIFEVGEQ